MAERSTATASVATQTPERYAKQLAAHLGRKLEVREEADGLRLLFGDGNGSSGDCLLRAREAALELSASAVDPAALERITQVVGSHLERFGQRNELVVSWQS